MKINLARCPGCMRQFMPWRDTDVVRDPIRCANCQPPVDVRFVVQAKVSQTWVDSSVCNYDTLDEARLARDTAREDYPYDYRIISRLVVELVVEQ